MLGVTEQGLEPENGAEAQEAPSKDALPSEKSWAPGGSGSHALAWPQRGPHCQTTGRCTGR